MKKTVKKYNETDNILQLKGNDKNKYEKTSFTTKDKEQNERDENDSDNLKKRNKKSVEQFTFEKKET